MKSSIIIAFMLAFLSATFAAQAQENLREEKHFTYKGFPIGGSLDDFKKKFPDWKCTKTTCDYDFSCKIGKKYKECQSRNSFGGVNIDIGRAGINKNKKICNILLAVPQSDADYIVQSLTTTFGNPKPTELNGHPTLEWEHERELLWFTEDYDLTIKGSKKSTIYISSAGCAHESPQLDEEKLKRGAKDF